EDGIRDGHVTGVQTCALPISYRPDVARRRPASRSRSRSATRGLPPRPRAIPRPSPVARERRESIPDGAYLTAAPPALRGGRRAEIGRASCRERVEIAGVAGSV